MTLRYHARGGRLCPEYVLPRAKRGIENAEPVCQRIPGLGSDIDRVVSDILLELVNPVTLEVALTRAAGTAGAPG